MVGGGVQHRPGADLDEHIVVQHPVVDRLDDHVGPVDQPHAANAIRGHGQQAQGLVAVSTSEPR